MDDEDGERQQLVVLEADVGMRLDRLLARQIAELSRSRLKTLILAGHVAIGAEVVRDPSHHVAAGDAITLTVPPPEPADPLPETIALTVVYEDAELLVIDKPAGLVVHPGAGNWTGTLVNALIAHCGDSLSGIGGVRRPGIVHRLDKETSGLLVVAKNDRSHQMLAAQFADHRPEKTAHRAYLAFAWGAPDRPRGIVDKPIGRHPQARDKQAIRADGRAAVTHWHVLERYPGSDGKPAASMMECRLETGRTHQIRVHLTALGHPLLGDPVYGAGFRTKAALLTPEGRAVVAGLGRQALHAYLLGIIHPVSGDFLEFRSELPGDLARLRHVLRGGAG